MSDVALYVLKQNVHQSWSLSLWESILVKLNIFKLEFSLLSPKIAKEFQRKDLKIVIKMPSNVYDQKKTGDNEIKYN